MLLRYLSTLCVSAVLAGSVAAQPLSKGDLLELERQKQAQEKQGNAKQLPSSCIDGSFVNLTPTDVIHDVTIRRVNDSARVLVWRETCNDFLGSPNGSAVMLRITPITPDIFICGPSFGAIQNGIQYESIKLVNAPGASSFCGDLIIEQTFAVDQWSFDEQFDENEEFRLIYGSGDDLVNLLIPKFESATPGPEVRRVTLEEPVNGAVAAGISNIRGWAVSSEGVDRVEIYIDGQFAFEVPYGGSRLDVQGAFPDVPESDESGFGATYSYQLLSAGEHTMAARMVSDDGAITESSSTFRVVDFGQGFLTEAPDMSSASSIVLPNGDVQLTAVGLPGDRSYNVVLRWVTATQQWDIVSIAQQ